MFEDAKEKVNNHIADARGRAGVYAGSAVGAAVASFLDTPDIPVTRAEKAGYWIGEGIRGMTSELIQENAVEAAEVSNSAVIERIEQSLITPEDGPFKRFFKRVFSRILFGSMRLGSYIALKSFFYRKPEEDEEARRGAIGFINLLGLPAIPAA